MTQPIRINREAAEALFSRFAPMFAMFEERAVDYCLVDGLAVVAHCLARGEGGFRATEDADAMVPQSYSNADFARDYLRVYAADPKFGEAIYDAVIGEGGFDNLSTGENAFINISFVGADEDLDGVDTPDFDVCRMLNGKTLENLERERLVVLGQEVWVATVNELLNMKRNTIELYGSDFESSARPQDFVDVGILNRMSGVANGGAGSENGYGLLSGLSRILRGQS